MSLLGSDTILLARLIQFVGKTDGRDKLAKGLQNYCRYMTWARAGDDAKRFKRVQSSLSEFRSIIKFGKWLKSYKELGDCVGSDRMSLGDYAESVALIGDIGYKLGDNIEYLSKYKILSFDPERCEAISKTFQFWAYLFDVLKDIHALANLDPSSSKYEAKKRALMLDFIGDFADFCRVTPAYLEMNNIGGVKKHAGFSGVCGMLVGVLGVYKVWNKCK